MNTLFHALTSHVSAKHLTFVAAFLTLAFAVLTPWLPRENPDFVASTDDVANVYPSSDSKLTNFDVPATTSAAAALEASAISSQNLAHSAVSSQAAAPFASPNASARQVAVSSAIGFGQIGSAERPQNEPFRFEKEDSATVAPPMASGVGFSESSSPTGRSGDPTTDRAGSAGAPISSAGSATPPSSGAPTLAAEKTQVRADAMLDPGPVAANPVPMATTASNEAPKPGANHAGDQAPAPSDIGTVDLQPSDSLAPSGVARLEELSPSMGTGATFATGETATQDVNLLALPKSGDLPADSDVKVDPPAPANNVTDSGRSGLFLAGALLATLWFRHRFAAR